MLHADRVEGWAVGYSVGKVAALAGVTVRTLHHYDAIGLLVPSGRSATDHRRYAAADLERLQRILFYRELGFPLEQIAAILDDPHTDAAGHLRRQHTLLRERIARLQAMAAAVARALEAQAMGISLTPEEQFEVLGDFKPEEYAAEAEQRWGESDAYRASQRRASQYSKADWQQIKAESDAIEQGFAAALAAGVPAADPRATALAEQHRLQICRWFYDCSPAMQRGLAEMYVVDPRFAAHYDAIAPGLAQYVHDAIVAPTGRHG
jgi:MerR family transcriptional regulator, thiopeptide resistance regulator